MDRRTVREALGEDRDRHRRKALKSRRRRMQFLAMAVCLVALVAVMYGGLSLISWLRRKPQAAMQGNVSGLTLDESGNVVKTEREESGTQESGPGESSGEDTQEALSDRVVYSQEELDARIAEVSTQARQEGADQVLDSIRTGLVDGDTVVETLRPFYPDDIIVASGGQYHFVPIDRSLLQSQLAPENLNFLESGEAQYLVDGQVVSHKGIDVSKHQGTIDWNLVAQDGVEFAFIRTGYRGYGSEGKLVEDENFVKNIEGAQAAGIKVGVYFYSQAVTEAEALEEADLVLRQIAPYTLDCPVVFDVEKVSGNGRMNKISVEERTHLTKLFCQTIADAGYTPMIYHNTEMGALMLDLAQLEDYEKWFAAYTDTLYYPYEYKIWQYSAKGRVPGISTEVDLNISFSSLWDETE